jgi:hypothetical protein
MIVQAAKARGVSVGELLRSAVTHYLQPSQIEPEPSKLPLVAGLGVDAVLENQQRQELKIDFLCGILTDLYRHQLWVDMDAIERIAELGKENPEANKRRSANATNVLVKVEERAAIGALELDSCADRALDRASDSGA